MVGCAARILLLGSAVVAQVASHQPDPETTLPESMKPKAQQDLDALDAAAQEVDSAAPVKVVHAQVQGAAKHKRVTMRRRVEEAKANAKGEAAAITAAVERRSILGVKHADDFTVSDAAEEVLAKGDALAKKSAEARHEKELQKLAPAKVVRVKPTNSALAMKKALEGSLNLERDVTQLRDQTREDAEKKAAEQRELEDEHAERANLEGKHLARLAKEQKKKGPHKTDLTKLAKLSAEAHANAAAQR